MVFHIYEFRSLSGGFFFMTLFSVMGGVLIGALIGKMRERAAYIVTIVVTAVLCLFFCAEIVYKSVFQKFLALFSMLGVAGQAFDFIDVIGKNILLTIGGLILLWLPMIFLIIGKRKNVIRISTVFLEGKHEKNRISSGNVSGSNSDPWLYEPGTVQLE